MACRTTVRDHQAQPFPPESGLLKVLEEDLPLVFTLRNSLAKANKLPAPPDGDSIGAKDKPLFLDTKGALPTSTVA